VPLHAVLLLLHLFPDAEGGRQTCGFIYKDGTCFVFHSHDSFSLPFPDVYGEKQHLNHVIVLDYPRTGRTTKNENETVVGDNGFH
jgi:hypothetical protein